MERKTFADAMHEMFRLYHQGWRNMDEDGQSGDMMEFEPNIERALAIQPALDAELEAETERSRARHRIALATATGPLAEMRRRSLPAAGR